MTDTPLFDPPPAPAPADQYDETGTGSPGLTWRLARRTDPATSKEAALHAAGHLGDWQERVLEAVKRHPGLTSSELSRAEEIPDPRHINRRLPELETLGLIRRNSAKTCSVTGRSAATWTAL